MATEPRYLDLRAGLLPHRAAWDQSLRNSTKPALAKGQPVSLPDGRQGRIVYLDPNMRIVRVRTDDGKSETVRQSALKPTDHVPVQSHCR